MCPRNPDGHANVVLLASAYSYFSNISSGEILNIVQKLNPQPFRDASLGNSSYTVLVEDILYSFKAVMTKKIFHI